MDSCYPLRVSREQKLHIFAQNRRKAIFDRFSCISKFQNSDTVNSGAVVILCRQIDHNCLRSATVQLKRAILTVSRISRRNFTR